MSATPKVATPSAPILDWDITGAATVELTCETAGAEIYYTVDGTNVTKEKTKYTEAIVITQTTNLKAKAYAIGFTASDELHVTYTVTV